MNQRDKELMIEFCQELIRVPSLSGDEEDVASLIKDEMSKLGYDEVWADDAGNVIGKLAGNDKSAPSLTFTAHMDQVDVSPSEDWEHDLFGGEIDGGYIHGRGASDTKGAIATQVYVTSALNELTRPHGDVYVAAVVLEETGGLGTKYLLSHFETDYAVMGEGTKNELRIGNRGRVLVRVNFQGESMHSSAAPPEDVLHYDVMKFLERLKGLKMASGELGSSHVVPTLCKCDNPGSNVTPGEIELSVDWRTVETEASDEVLERIIELLPQNAAAHIDPMERGTYTGIKLSSPDRQSSYYISPDNQFVREVRESLQERYGRDVPVSTWDFTTDCGYFADAGIPIVGFSPCEEKYAHTQEDRVSISLMEEAVDGYGAIIESVPELPGQTD